MQEQHSYTRLPQSGETPTRVLRSKHFFYRYAYARSADTRTANDSGQDYLTFYESKSTFAFALCDGVSQSFYGDLAARILGEALIVWLTQQVETLDSQAIRVNLSSYLSYLTSKASEAVQKQALPENLPPMLRDVLEQKREHGSDSTFVCGRIDLPGPSFPRGRVVLAWMGDSRLRIWGPQGERTTELGDTFKTAERWSSSRGPVGGEPDVFVSDLKRQAQYAITRLLTYSDGLSALDPYDRELSNAALQDMINESGEAATSDDVSVLELWLTGLPAHIAAKPIAPPQRFTAVLQGRQIRATWEPMPYVAHYQLEVRRELRPQESTQNNNRLHVPEREVLDLTALEWVSTDLPAGAYKLRVRAWDGNGPGQWTDTIEVEVPTLPRETTPARALVTKLLDVGSSGGIADADSTNLVEGGSFPSAEWAQTATNPESDTSRAGELAAEATGMQLSAFARSSSDGSGPGRLIRSRPWVVGSLIAGGLLVFVLLSSFLFVTWRELEAQTQARSTATAVAIISAHETATMQAEATVQAQVARASTVQAQSTAQVLQAVATEQAQEIIATATAEAQIIYAQATATAQARETAIIAIREAETALARTTETALAEGVGATVTAQVIEAGATTQAIQTATAQAVQISQAATAEAKATKQAQAAQETATVRAILALTPSATLTLRPKPSHTATAVRSTATLTAGSATATPTPTPTVTPTPSDTPVVEELFAQRSDHSTSV